MKDKRKPESIPGYYYELLDSHDNAQLYKLNTLAGTPMYLVRMHRGHAYIGYSLKIATEQFRRLTP